MKRSIRGYDTKEVHNLINSHLREIEEFEEKNRQLRETIKMLQELEKLSDNMESYSNHIFDIAGGNWQNKNGKLQQQAVHEDDNAVQKIMRLISDKSRIN